MVSQGIIIENKSGMFGGIFMKIDINKDFEENYKNTWKSLTTEEVITAGIALLFAGGVVYLAWRFLGIPIEIG